MLLSAAASPFDISGEAMAGTVAWPQCGPGPDEGSYRCRQRHESCCLQVPRLHAITIIREADAAGASGALDAGARARAGELRGGALGALAVALGGDRLAAEYVLLQLVSRCGAAQMLLAHDCRFMSSTHRKATQVYWYSEHNLALVPASFCTLLITICLTGVRSVTWGLHYSCAVATFDTAYMGCTFAVGKAQLCWLQDHCNPLRLAEAQFVRPACRVYTRQDAVVVGPLSLNITGCPRSSLAARASEPDQAPAAPSGTLAAALQAAIGALVPRCTAVPVSVEQVRVNSIVVWSASVPALSQPLTMVDRKAVADSNGSSQANLGTTNKGWCHISIHGIVFTLFKSTGKHSLSGRQTGKVHGVCEGGMCPG